MNERKNTSYILLLAAFMLCFLTIYEVKKANGANKKRKTETKAQLKKVSKVKTLKRLPKKKFPKKPTQKKISSRELSEFMQKKLLVFEGIQFQINGECPDSFSEEEVNEDRDINQECRSPIKELAPGLDLFTEQTFLNGRIVEYSYHLEALEPISIDFNGPDELKRLSLWLEGAVVFGITFKNNLVSKVHTSTRPIFDLEKSLDFYNKKKLKTRFKVLLTEKKKLENILNDLCMKTHHSKTCKTHKELIGFEYPLPPKLLASIIQL